MTPKPKTFAELAAFQKAKSTANLVPVYDATGALVGLVDKKNLQPVAAPPADKAAAQVNANIAADPSHPASEDIEKALDGATLTGYADIAKSAGNTDEAFARLLGAIDAQHRGPLQSAVSMVAMRTALTGRVTSKQAVALAKQAAIEAVAKRPRRRLVVSEDEAYAQLKKRIGPTI